MPTTSNRAAGGAPAVVRLTDPDPRLRHAQAAAYIGISPNTLQNWRISGRQDRKIPFLKVGSLVQYRRSDLDAWLAKNTIGKL